MLSAGLPNITGSIELDVRETEPLSYADDCIVKGSLYIVKTTNSDSQIDKWANAGNDTGTSIKAFKFNASNSSSIYGNSKTVQPPTIKLISQIRY